MDDLISRQQAIEECKLEFLNPNVERETEELTLIDQSFANGWNQANSIWINALEKLPSAQPEQPEPCELCSNLEKGDTLYQYSDWDGGIGFDYIRDIQYCPMCGRRLTDG